MGIGRRTDVVSVNMQWVDIKKMVINLFPAFLQLFFIEKWFWKNKPRTMGIGWSTDVVNVNMQWVDMKKKIGYILLLITDFLDSGVVPSRTFWIRRCSVNMRVPPKSISPTGIGPSLSPFHLRRGLATRRIISVLRLYSKWEKVLIRQVYKRL